MFVYYCSAIVEEMAAVAIFGGVAKPRCLFMAMFGTKKWIKMMRSIF